MIKLTYPERRLRDFLLVAANAWPKKPDQDPLAIRFAGGWVRDKLLSKDTNDIDIALNVTTGTQFAVHVETLLQQNPSYTDSTFRFKTINRNVEQSKHLETATADFLGLKLDFVNLRSEKYTATSRIPEKMEFGTPKEDAERRDLTINSLFYNLQDQVIEDWTGLGIDDLRNGIIRTPLDPMNTFMDDPLRVLRAVRFAARFNFKILPEVKTAILDPNVKVNLSSVYT
jgi:tRNA nucleotidyltransferase (CCA-adding enzyme)